MPLLPIINGWIDSARTSRYQAAALGAGWRLAADQLVSFFDVIGYDCHYWLKEVRFWDAAALVCADRRLFEIEVDLFIADGFGRA